MTNTLNLSDLNGSNGFVINGINASDFSGYSVNNAGDINGDGFDDILIGARSADPNGKDFAGESYVVFGRNGGFNSSLELSSLNGRNGFVINGIDANDFSGFSVSSAGDVNGDGFDDILIGARGADPNGRTSAGESYVVFGGNRSFDASFELSSLDGSNGFLLNGIDLDDRSGNSVSSAGDVNGDGFDDLIIGARWADPNGKNFAGESYVAFGSNSGFGTSLDLSSLDGNNGFVLNGIDTSDVSGVSVSGAGDVNGDGFDDVIIGASLADPNGRTSAGESYVVFGGNSGFGASLDLSSLDGSNGFVLQGAFRSDFSGDSVSSAGDINGDGFDDLIIGARLADPNNRSSDAGESYVVFGGNSGFGASLDLSGLNGSNGFTINGIDRSDFSGVAVSGAGDVNGDGYDDLIIGARGADPNGNSGAGESYVVFGGSSGFGASLDLSSLNGSNGFTINGIDVDDFSGYSVSGGGDVNDDGYDDLIVGAAFADPNGESAAGESYVVFGFQTFVATSSDDDLFLNGNDNTLHALPGNDTVRARGGDDEVFGNDGNDKLFGQNGADTLDGGADNDTVNGGNGNDLLIGGVGNDRLNGGFENDTLIGVDESSSNPGLGDRDFLNGQNGADLFVLGNASTAFYDDDGIAVADGNVSRALIRDLDVGVDRIQLHGSASDYGLRESASGNTNIFFQPQGQVRDLIGIVRNTTGLDLSDSSTFVFV
ncbi:hypothetical protein [Zarconia navalis]|uniref:hypothetical protein n=1 Tax=Zarconia navalis TaxID=2992134 RepID=UPI0021F84FCC|nr:hypothetical protein [Zarconia navalis]